MYRSEKEEIDYVSDPPSDTLTPYKHLMLFIYLACRGFREVADTTKYLIQIRGSIKFFSTSTILSPTQYFTPSTMVSILRTPHWKNLM